MQNLARRPSGIYVFRLAVPIALRPFVGKREILISTGTRELSLAKIVAGAAATQWRQRFFDLSRLIAVSGIDSLDHHEIIRIVTGSPALLAGGHLPLPLAASASGLTVEHLLRAAAEAKVGLHVRAGILRGHLVPIEELEPIDPRAGSEAGVVIPPPRHMPAGAVEHSAGGVLQVLGSDVSSTTAALLRGERSVGLLALQAPGRPGMWFVPDEPVVINNDVLELAAHEVEALRRSVASLIQPERVQEARDHEKAAPSRGGTGCRASEPLSKALNHFISNRVKHDVESPGEIKRIRNGCGLLIDLEGDLTLSAVTTERLREFRDLRLAKVPARENKVRLIYKTSSVRESLKAVEGADWPIMSASERDKRMRWIGAWFRWLQEQKWIQDDPAAPLRGESVETKLDRRKKAARRDDEARQAYTEADLARIFSARWYQTGRGELTRRGTYRTFLPFYYWGPLIAVLSGGPRINEVSQLHLRDIGKTSAGTWFIDFNEVEGDKKLKNTSSRRRVPLHPLLKELGFLQWVAALRGAGHDRLFPELKRDEEKGYGKAASKWFTGYMARLGFPRDGTLVFHSFRHTFTNALPSDTPERLGRQLAGHARGADVHDKVYRKDMGPDEALQYVRRLNVTLPTVAPFNVEAGLKATADALRRKRASDSSTGPGGLDDEIG